MTNSKIAPGNISDNVTNTPKPNISAEEQKSLLELENFIYQHIPERRAPGVVADLIGVFIGLKPVAVDQFEIDKISATDYDKFTTLLDFLGLKILFKDNMLCTSKDPAKNQEICQAFDELHKNFDKSGQIIDPDLWRKLSLQIGELFGYPMTAVTAFIKQGMKGQSFESKEKLITVGGPNRYYAHSIKHEKDEFEAYDLPINQAIEKYAPKTAKIYREDTTKRWLNLNPPHPIQPE